MQFILAGNLNGQKLANIQIILDVKGQTVVSIFDLIEQQSGFTFSYTGKVATDKTLLDLNLSGTLKNVLEVIATQTSYNFKRVNNEIFVIPRQKMEEVKIMEETTESTITGKVTDEEGEPLIGATVLVKGTTIGSVTDIDGNFTLSAPDNAATLIVSFAGFESQEVPIGSQRQFTVALKSDASALDEVIVVGYGTVKKSDLTGSVSSVQTEEAYAAPASSLDNALQGRSAGVQVTSVSGAPGENATIRIRGGNSITAGNEPLYVIDGFVGAGNLSTLNPNDIASIQILKDASSTAIYGARGTNGVVLITTKKGSEGKTKVTINSSYGFQVLPEKVDVQNASEFANFVNSGDTDPTDGIPFDLNNLPGADTDWQEELLQSAPVTDNQVSVSGGSEKLQYYVSGGYLSQKGLIIGSNFERFSLRTNFDNQLSETFKTGVSLSLSSAITDITGTDFQSLMRADPMRPVYDDDGNFSTENVAIGLVTDNEVANAMLNMDKNKENRALMNTYIEASFLDNFTLRSSFGGDFLFSKQDQFIPSSNPSSIVAGLLAQGEITQITSIDLLNENTINYTKTFGKHSIAVLGGVTVQKQKVEATNIVANEIPNDDLGVNAVELAPIEQTFISSDYSEFALFSVLGRINYAYNNKYLATASVRRDGSSKLGVNNQFAVFPSFALAWKLSEESFLSGATFVDALKLRTSYGLTGNQNIDPFSTLSSYASDATAILAGVPAAGLYQGTLENPNLKWETTRQFDVGVDFTLFQGRLFGELDYYFKKTEDLLLEAEVPFFTGFETIIQNVGSLQNYGVDITLGGVIVETDNFEWEATLNVSTFENEVLDLGSKSFISTHQLGGASNDDTGRLIVGQPVGTFWGAIYDGVDAETGEPIYRDISGPDGVPDGSYDEEYDQTVIGNANPDFFGGFQHNFRYKNFDLQAFFQFTYGNDIYNIDMDNITSEEINSIASVRENVWTTENTVNASIPGVGTSFNESNSFFIQDGSHFRLRTLQLGYTFPTNFINGIERLRMYFTGTNLFLIKSDDYLGYDPDVSNFGTDNVLRGYDNFAYPQSRSFIFGINLTF